MGCAPSRHVKRCRHCRSAYSPEHRKSYSLHAHVLPPGHGDGGAENGSCDNDCEAINGQSRKSKEFSLAAIEAKAWSGMIEEDKVLEIPPETPTTMPPGEPEAINAWELMEGLEDTSPARPFNHKRSFSFHPSPKDVSVPSPAIVDPPKSPLKRSFGSSPNPSSKSILSDFDPDIISTFRKALAELSPSKLSPARSLRCKVDDDVCHVFDEMKKTNVDADSGKRGALQQNRRVVFYFTSLRGVRKTHEDCCDLRSVLKGSGYRVDERDVSMHSGFKEELKELLGDDGVRLPSVFAGRRHIGGVEEVRRLHEEGELEKALEGCEMAGDGGVCEGCGDVRFVPCETCCGSCKVYCEDEEGVGGEGFRRCPDCNENGIRRCPICCL